MPLLILFATCLFMAQDGVQRLLKTGKTDTKPHSGSRWLIGALVLWCVVQPRWQGRLSAAVGFALILTWWLRLQPKQDRDWKPEVTQLGSAAVDGARVTVQR